MLRQVWPGPRPVAERQTPTPQDGTTATAGKTTRSNPWHYLTGRMAQEKGGKG